MVEEIHVLMKKRMFGWKDECLDGEMNVLMNEWVGKIKNDHETIYFWRFQWKHVGPTDQPTDRSTDWRTWPLIEARVSNDSLFVG